MGSPGIAAVIFLKIFNERFFYEKVHLNNLEQPLRDTCLKGLFRVRRPCACRLLAGLCLSPRRFHGPWEWRQQRRAGGGACGACRMKRSLKKKMQMFSALETVKSYDRGFVC